MKVSGIDATYYIVKDVTALTPFYADLLGAQPDAHWENQLSEWTFADGNSFGLYQTSSGDKVANGCVMFAVDDVAAAVAAGKSRNVHFHEDGAVTDTPACHMAFGEDPDGNQFILHKRKAETAG
ncbi:MAG TPA: VOC family protein [Candidatus Baltobacteraceae bacterium]|jgi:catechol 2,3-dioxygenase-like lactoylglutathione lyase family enzyme